ncbi:hypothetical protein DFH08DRAFT_971906 [Mycena albidolilacea]|uniref:Uncharacterized protein n=1 Tax=Mycena albidolilacea TaxID=1033008 RepID=A0AAD6ZCD1_9AGAR|nr:hypothetical protein DFH08DRAFT_971906 [Mycena albidolilacea]
MALYLNKPLSCVLISTDVQAEALIHAHSNVEETLPDQTADVSVDTQTLVAGATDAHATMIADVSADVKTPTQATEATDDQDVTMTTKRFDFASTLEPSMATSSATASDSLDLTRNRNENVSLGPFDARVSMIIRFDGESYYVATNASYVPALPIRPNHSVFLREDMRFGKDDPTLWPQNYSSFFYFIVLETGLTVTRGLGKLKHTRIAQLAAPIETFLEQYQTARPQLTKVQDLLEPLVQQVRLGLEHIQILPSTFNQVVGVTALQRMFLEAKALVRYMTEFKPCMVDLGSKSPPPAEHCVGVFTIDPAIAQQFSAAGLPYWLLRPTWTFTTKNILEVVAPRLPADYLMLDPTPDATHFSTKPDTDSKYAVIHKLSSKVPWYKDPFAGTSNPGSSVVSPAAATSSLQDGELCGSGLGIPSQQLRFDPCAVSPAAATSSLALPPSYSSWLHVHPFGSHGGSGGSSCGASTAASKGGPDKFAPLERDEMPPSISVWEDALKAVDRSISPSKTDSLYVFPEPALVVLSDNVARQQLFLQNLSLMMDALVYCLGDPDNPHDLLSDQQWRDVLVGNARAQRMVMRQGGGGQTQASARSIGLHELLAPTFCACRLENEDFTAMPGTAQPVTVHRAQEMLWMVAETNFRFELLALDHRASRLERPEECRKCFAGGQLMGMPLGQSKEGLASMSLVIRHPFFVRIARLMGHWHPRPRSAIIAEAQASESREWSQEEMLEDAVARHYTQAFYELFGRAAVIPSRLAHEFGT